MRNSNPTHKKRTKANQVERGTQCGNAMSDFKTWLRQSMVIYVCDQWHEFFSFETCDSKVLSVHTAIDTPIVCVQSIVDTYLHNRPSNRVFLSAHQLMVPRFAVRIWRVTIVIFQFKCLICMLYDLQLMLQIHFHCELVKKVYYDTLLKFICERITDW